ncbi:hypothetical protein CCACVL1_05743 [Corchorus capsularis]|uniref:Uncharacterized protein n=1 Tax=Corchorus capsularis TaxID=210143 RepID=A0A1R3JJ79_COCAP|nr:hypothetical protein CCACVL1_05743 [Corchorus capsularis]
MAYGGLSTFRPTNFVKQVAPLALGRQQLIALLLN